jgi:hypothetical protein
MRKKIKVRLNIVDADTLKYYLIYSIDKINLAAAKRGNYTAGEDRLTKTFNSYISQVNLTDQEEDQATQDAELIDHNYNTSKKN